MAGKKDEVNLDALIPREDLESKRAAQGRGGLLMPQLAFGQHYYGLLRKPHFQRETDDWTVDHIVSLIRSFRDGHLIPAVILWAAEGYTFVIDGAHRLSALIAWVNDDYGDGQISSNYFKGELSKRQKDLGKDCREKVRAAGCAYSELNKLTLLAHRTADQLKWSTNIAKSIEAQWVDGDSDVAATSFLAINQRSVPIEKTERYLIERRKAPNVVAARALVRSARGHAYWGEMDDNHVQVIEQKASSIYAAIFEPADAKPDADIELQPGGPAHTANGLRIAIDLVNTVNNIKRNDALDDDKNGEATARFIDKTHGVVKYVAGKNAASLSLHPAVYFWGATGNHRPSMFLAVVSFVQELVIKDELVKFTIHRARLEEFLVGNGRIAKELLGKHGGWEKSVTPIKSLLRTILDGLIAGKSDHEIEAQIMQGYAKVGTADSEGEMLSSATVWRETKAALRHQASLEAPRCQICKARLVPRDASDDHIKRRADGGSNNVINARMTHQYCNHGFAEHFTQTGVSIPEISLPPVTTVKG